jgi:deoxyribose-phosphate aldolase
LSTSTLSNPAIPHSSNQRLSTMSAFESYSDADWAKLFSEIESSLVVTDQPHPVADPGSPEFAKYIDHTLLKLDATEEQINQICDQAKAENFAVRRPSFPPSPRLSHRARGTPS